MERSTTSTHVRRMLVGVIPILCLVLGLLVAAEPVSAQDHKLDPSKVKGPDACGECHKSSGSIWKLTHHAKTYKEMPRTKEAKAIAKAMGIKRIRAESDCLSCHFTSAMVDGEATAIAGITCESCHGAGADWIKVHGDYGGADVTRDTEDAGHRSERLAKADAAGMIRPERLYQVAANCYGCHTVPNERLVNEGGHPAGSKFELVAWSQGEVRHNVQTTKENNGASDERKRMMYIVGKALDLEYGLRGVAKATEKAGYAKAMAKRAKRAEKSLQKIAELVQSPEIDEILKIAKGAKLKLNNEASLTESANQVAAVAQKLVSMHDGSAFAAVDALIPGADKYKGTVAK